MMRSNRKAQIAEEVLMTFVRITFLVIVLFSVVLMVKSFLITSVDIDELEADIMMTRMLYTPNALSYTDPDTGRHYPGVIDLRVVQTLLKNPNDQDSLFMSYGEDNPVIAARMILTQAESRIEWYFNKDKFIRWQPLTVSTVRGGPGSINQITKSEHVLVKDGEEYNQGTLTFQFLI